jgi:malate dehydrogenase
MANADFRSVKAIVAGMNGKHVVEEAIVYLLGVVGGSELARKLDVDYIAVKIARRMTGATEALPIENISENQMKLLQVAFRGIMINIETGVSFMSQ